MQKPREHADCYQALVTIRKGRGPTLSEWIDRRVVRGTNWAITWLGARSTWSMGWSRVSHYVRCTHWMYFFP